MRYNDVRPTLKTGDLLAWTHDGIESWHDFEVQLVRVGTRSEFTHVGVAFVFAQRVFVIEAVGTGVRIFPLSRLLPFYLVRKPKPLGEVAIEYAFQHIGVEYESKLAMVLAFITGESLANNKRLQCCELTRAIYDADDDPLDCEDKPTSVVRVAMETWGPLEWVAP